MSHFTSWYYTDLPVNESVGGWMQEKKARERGEKIRFLELTHRLPAMSFFQEFIDDGTYHGLDLDHLVGDCYETAKELARRQKIATRKTLSLKKQFTEEFLVPCAPQHKHLLPEPNLGQVCETDSDSSQDLSFHRACQDARPPAEVPTWPGVERHDPRFVCPSPLCHFVGARREMTQHCASNGHWPSVVERRRLDALRAEEVRAREEDLALASLVETEPFAVWLGASSWEAHAPALPPAAPLAASSVEIVTHADFNGEQDESDSDPEPADDSDWGAAEPTPTMDLFNFLRAFPKSALHYISVLTTSDVKLFSNFRVEVDAENDELESRLHVLMTVGLAFIFAAVLKGFKDLHVGARVVLTAALGLFYGSLLLSTLTFIASVAGAVLFVVSACYATVYVLVAALTNHLFAAADLDRTFVLTHAARARLIRDKNALNRRRLIAAAMDMRFDVDEPLDPEDARDGGDEEEDEDAEYRELYRRVPAFSTGVAAAWSKEKEARRPEPEMGDETQSDTDADQEPPVFTRAPPVRGGAVRLLSWALSQSSRFVSYLSASSADSPLEETGKQLLALEKAFGRSYPMEDSAPVESLEEWGLQLKAHLDKVCAALGYVPEELKGPAVRAGMFRYSESDAQFRPLFFQGIWARTEVDKKQTKLMGAVMSAVAVCGFTLTGQFALAATIATASGLSIAALLKQDTARVLKSFPWLATPFYADHPLYRKLNRDFTRESSRSCRQCEYVIRGRQGDTALFDHLINFIGFQETFFNCVGSDGISLQLISNALTSLDPFLAGAIRVAVNLLDIKGLVLPEPTSSGFDAKEVDEGALREHLRVFNYREITSLANLLSTLSQQRSAPASLTRWSNFVTESARNASPCTHCRSSKFPVLVAFVAIVLKCKRESGVTARFFAQRTFVNNAAEGNILVPSSDVEIAPPVVPEPADLTPTEDPRVPSTLDRMKASVSGGFAAGARFARRLFKSEVELMEIEAHAQDCGGAMMRLKCIETGLEVRAVLLEHSFPGVSDRAYFLGTTLDVIAPDLKVTAWNFVLSTSRGSQAIKVLHSTLLIKNASSELRGDRPLGTMLFQISQHNCFSLIANLGVVSKTLADDSKYKTSIDNRTYHYLRDVDRTCQIQSRGEISGSAIMYPLLKVLTKGDCGSPLTLNGEIHYLYAGVTADMMKSVFLRLPEPRLQQNVVVTHAKGAILDVGRSKKMLELVDHLGAHLVPPISSAHRRVQPVSVFTSGEYCWTAPNETTALLGLAYTAECKKVAPELDAVAEWKQETRKVMAEVEDALRSRFQVVDLAESEDYWTVLVFNATSSSPDNRFKNFLTSIRGENYIGKPGLCWSCNEVRPRVIWTSDPSGAKGHCVDCWAKLGKTPEVLWGTSVSDFRKRCSSLHTHNSWKAMFADMEAPSFGNYLPVVRAAFNDACLSVDCYLRGTQVSVNPKWLALSVFAKNEVCKMKKSDLGAARVVCSPSVFLNTVLNRRVYRDEKTGCLMNYETALISLNRETTSKAFPWFYAGETQAGVLARISGFKNPSSLDFSNWDRSVPSAVMGEILESRYPGYPLITGVLVTDATYNIMGIDEKFKQTPGNPVWLWPSGVHPTYSGNSHANEALQRCVSRRLNVPFRRATAGDDLLLEDFPADQRDALMKCYAKFGMSVKMFDDIAQFCAIYPTDPMRLDSARLLRKSVAHPQRWGQGEFACTIGSNLGTMLGALRVDGPELARHWAGIEGILRPDVLDIVDLANFKSAFDKAHARALKRPSPLVTSIETIETHGRHGRLKRSRAREEQRGSQFEDRLVDAVKEEDDNREDPADDDEEDVRNGEREEMNAGDYKRKAKAMGEKRNTLLSKSALKKSNQKGDVEAHAGENVPQPSPPSKIAQPASSRAALRSSAAEIAVEAAVAAGFTKAEAVAQLIAVRKARGETARNKSYLEKLAQRETKELLALLQASGPKKE